MNDCAESNCASVVAVRDALASGLVHCVGQFLFSFLCVFLT